MDWGYRGEETEGEGAEEEGRKGGRELKARVAREGQKKR